MKNFPTSPSLPLPHSSSRSPRLPEAFLQHLQNQRAPLAAVNLEAFDANVALIDKVCRSASDNMTLRIATKSLRCIPLIKRAMNKSSIFRGLLCYAGGEILHLVRQGFDDLNLCYPTMDPVEIQEFLQAHEEATGPKGVSIIVDHLAQVQALSEGLKGRKLRRPISLWIDLDASLRLFGGLRHIGVRRSPIRSVQQVLALAELIQEQAPTFQLSGVMCYEAQLAGLGDRNPFKPLINVAARWIHRSTKSLARTRRAAVKEALIKAGYWHKDFVFNGGGSGSLHFSAQDPSLTEVSLGSGLLCSTLFDYYSDESFEPGLYVGLRAQRYSDPGFFTVFGGGYAASGSPGWDKLPIPLFSSSYKFSDDEGCGEVQTPVQCTEGQTPPPLGSLFWVRPAKVGECAERFNQFFAWEDGRLLSLPTYRGEGLNFG